MFGVVADRLEIPGFVLNFRETFSAPGLQFVSVGGLEEPK